MAVFDSSGASRIPVHTTRRMRMWVGVGHIIKEPLLLCTKSMAKCSMFNKLGILFCSQDTARDFVSLQSDVEGLTRQASLEACIKSTKLPIPEFSIIPLQSLAILPQYTTHHNAESSSPHQWLHRRV